MYRIRLKLKDNLVDSLPHCCVHWFLPYLSVDNFHNKYSRQCILVVKCPSNLQITMSGFGPNEGLGWGKLRGGNLADRQGVSLDCTLPRKKGTSLPKQPPHLHFIMAAHNQHTNQCYTEVASTVKTHDAFKTNLIR